MCLKVSGCVFGNLPNKELLLLKRGQCLVFFMKELTVKDKVRILATGEGAEIIRVLSNTEAIVDAFDGQITVHAAEVTPFRAGDSNAEQIMFSAPRVKKKTIATKRPTFNEQKNQFPYEIDLHADKLIDNPDNHTDEEILSIQLSRAKTYVQRAIDMRVKRVYLIHGVGSGRLKSEIHDYLRSVKQVTQFLNEPSKTYGIGATEVRF